MLCDFKVKKGELWEFFNPDGYPVERHAVVYITRVFKCASGSSALNRDRYEYLEILGDDVQYPVLRKGHLTIRVQEYNHLWKRLA